jgi:O-antigen/teichoic acid export membrane protein
VQRRFIGNLVFLQALNWLIKPIWIFGIDRLAQVQLGDEWYGKYYVIFSFGLLFNILLDFGLNSYVASEVGKTHNPQVAKPVLGIRLWLAGLYVVLILALGIWQQFPIGILILAIVNQVLAGFVLFFRSILQGKHLFKTDSIVSVTDRLVAIVLCAVFLFYSGFSGEKGVWIFLGTQTLGYLLALLLAIYFAWFYKPVITEKINELKLANLLRQTAWFAVLAFAMSIFTRIDTLMLKNLAEGGYVEAGKYAKSFRLLDAAIIFSTLISSMLLPIFSRMIHQKENTDSLVWLNLRIVLFVAVPASLMAWFFGAEILGLLYGKTYTQVADLQNAQKVFYPVMTCFIPMALVHVFGTWLTAAGKVKILAYLAFSAVFINVVLNAIWIPKNGAEGAGWAGLITQSVFALGCMVYAIRFHAFQLQLKRILLLVIWVAASIITFIFIYQLKLGFNGLLLAAAAYLAITVISGLFYSELRKAIVSK